ncbi:tRNA (cytidine32/guanosine34-2'-O)-methyltransferase, partial [Tremellales sp. Uapishka_1]
MPSSKTTVDKRDVYYRKGKSEGYRARSAYKLLHLDEEFDLFSNVQTAVDLCAAPGSWSQVLSQKLQPGKANDTKVVSVDLQAMAPLANIMIMQTDITLPSTIPLVLNALGGRKADLVVCDGAPDVTGVHDLDAYLHSQLLLAALTLSLTLLAPHATLIFKIFLSPLDPKAALLRSQLRSFFPTPPSSSESGRDAEDYKEFDDVEQAEDGHRVEGSGRRGGVWVRKPRSSRQGSGEAFIVCRNFDPSTVPLPQVFSSSALKELEKQSTGTLTLESLATLGEVEMGKEGWDEWERVKGFVGGGDLNAMASSSTRTSPRDLLSKVKTDPEDQPAVESTCTPIDLPNGAIDSTTRPPIYLSPARLHLASNARYSNPTRRAAALSGSSVDSLSPTSPTMRPWDRTQGPPSPLPSPLYLHPPGAPSDGILSLPKDVGMSMPDQDGAVSPALSSASKTDLFFKTSQKDALPLPPRPLPNSSTLGRGLPSTFQSNSDALRPSSAASPKSSIFDPDPDPVRPWIATSSPSKPRAVSTPNPQIQPNPIYNQPLATLPTLPDVTLLSPSRPAPLRKPSSFARENREVAKRETSLRSGDELVPENSEQHHQFTWKLDTYLGEGAFSEVWSVVSTTSSQSHPQVAAVKMMDKWICESNSRTKISFVREVEVLKHISHPSIVEFLDSFSTRSHHCMILEKLNGGELFDLISRDENRDRMLIPCAQEGDEEGFGFVRRIFGELVRAVGWLHAVGVVHRDIKLENILFTIDPFKLPPTGTDSIPISKLPTPLIKLTDFGLSRFISPESPYLETRCGSESFAAPEIIMGRAYDGRQTDSWAIGVVLYTLIAGELPFDSDFYLSGRARSNSIGLQKDERKRKMMRIAKGEYGWREGVGSEDARALVGKLLERDPKKRLRVGSEEIWDEQWMKGPGEVRRPEFGANEDIGEGKRKILDGFLVDPQKISEVASKESVDG